MRDAAADECEIVADKVPEEEEEAGEDEDKEDDLEAVLKELKESAREVFASVEPRASAPTDLVAHQCKSRPGHGRASPLMKLAMAKRLKARSSPEADAVPTPDRLMQDVGTPPHEQSADEMRDSAVSNPQDAPWRRVSSDVWGGEEATKNH